jgi:2-polyprenyl-3-methyl-5-hydroxy-6-metoxy-1,4-benzoquinol methylase
MISDLGASRSTRAKDRHGRFASTVAYYESARPPYGSAFFAGVALELGLDGSQRLLDVGAGPGILAIGFARFCREGVGVDPEPGMVEAARAAAERAGVAVRFVEGRFEDVAASLGAFDIVSIGRAIHWLDPEPAQAALERALAWGKGSGLRRDKRQRRAQPVARDFQRRARSLEGR